MRYIDEAGQIVETGPRVVGSVAQRQDISHRAGSGLDLRKVAKLIFILVAGFAVLSYLDKQDLIDLPEIPVSLSAPKPAELPAFADGEVETRILAGTRAQISGRLSKGSQEGRYILETERGDILIELVDGNRWLEKPLLIDIEFTGEGGRFRILHIDPIEETQ